MVKERSGLNSWVRVSEPGDRAANGNGNENGERRGDYHEFKDVAINGGWEYSGDGRDVIEFFKKYSNHYDIINNLTYQEQRAFQKWTAGHLMDSRQWQEWSRISPDLQRTIMDIARKLDAARIDRGIVVVRGGSAQLLGLSHRVSDISQLQALKGEIKTSSGLMSWGAAKEGLLIGDTSKNVEYRLRIPEGTKGSGMWIGDSKIHGWGAAQREYITNRDISVRVGDSHYDRRRGKFIVELEYVGKKKHPWQ